MEPACPARFRSPMLLLLSHQSEPRFRGIGVEVRDGTVYVRRGEVPGRRHGPS
ncbi:MAG: hypothetical protein U0797_22535 [Gemmataceae bacterium]